MDNMPMYLKIKEHLEILIRMNQNAPNYRLPSESQLTKQFGVSHPTVRHAFSLLEEEEKIYRLQGKGAYIKHKEAVIAHKRYRVGIIIPTIENYFIRLMVRSACYHLNQRQIDSYIRFIGDDYKEEENSIYTVIRQEFHGILIFPTYQNIHNKAYLKLAMSQYPLVEIGRRRQGLQISSVCGDHFRQGYAAAQFLHEKGHTKIGFLSESAESSEDYADRIRGYESYVRSKIGASAVRLAEYDLIASSSIPPFALIQKLLTEHDNITALIIPARFMVQLAEYLEQSGRTPPEILVLDEMISDFRAVLPFDLYMLSQQPQEIGYQAVNQLCGLMDGTAKPQEIIVPEKIEFLPRPFIG
ncbi:MAG: GntR family transcriptional regulator [Oscillospiraceae bacterium]|nr:GntR family transcriptional regulator [Oscillospiraceae bacterium]